MPCERFVPQTVNNKYIASELAVNNPEKRTMYKENLELHTPITSRFSLERESHHRKFQEECCQEAGSDEKLNSKIFQKEVRYQVFGYRTLPRVFSAFGDFEAIKETESPIDDVSVPSEWASVPRLQESRNLRRKSTTNVTSKTRLDVDWLPYSSPKNSHRRSSEGSVVSARESRGLGKYQNYSESILSSQPSERKKAIDILQQINNTETSFVDDRSRRSSLAAMNAIPETLSDSNRFHSLPRKLSLPVENRRSPTNLNGKKQRNSLPTSSNNSESSTLDNDTDIQWEMLVARAKNFQKLSSTEAESKHSKVKKTDDVKMRNEATGFHTKSGDQIVSSICDSQDIEAKENDASLETKQRRKSEEKLKESVKSTDEIKTKDNSSMSLTETETTKSGQVDLTIKNRHDIDLQLQKDRNTRRYSLATVRPQAEIREKISGYSTHGALEYARMLLGKIQSEGRTKSKKERLEEMSKALKMVLEELNRIDLPDRELVSLFVSLRAEIVNLRAELKAEEKHELTKNDKQTKNDETVRSKTLPRARSTSENVVTQPNFRRFSWC